ncbi:c-type cytochrome [Amphritea sp. 1_MG-2023]|uniref:c-type cytochrome n=1 Tax=Amphritea sp. 1_MG-2023 TaxID=3062670 RepID=UPI0026E31CCE|nr:c-type cytochrome [Amphritea sp. 1_MG-2023]MDO6562445.1 c-type cytochrome [Amphritea sp. 1_MG-2023]
MNKLLIAILASVSIISVAHAAGDAAAGQGKVAVCGACHGADGNSAVGNFPKLAGQNERYLLKQLQEIKAGDRQVVEMTGLLTNLNDQDLADIAAYFASKNIQIGAAKADLVEAGEKIYRAGVESKGVAACTACHGAQGKGIASAGYPSLGGQHAQYVETQLKNFRVGTRNNDPQAMMSTIAAKLSDKEIQAVASYIQGLN